MVCKNISYAKTITNLVNQGKSLRAITLFSQLHNSGSPISEFVLSAAARACGSAAAAVTEGEQLHCVVTKSGFSRDVVLSTSLVDMYSKSDRPGEARRVFDEMPVRDLFATNTMVSALCRSGLAAEAVELFDSMPARSVESWNSLISGLGQIPDHKRSGLSLFNRMRSEGGAPAPDGVTMVAVLSICADLADLPDGARAHGLVIRSGLGSYTPVGNAIVDMYSKCGSVDSARTWFDAMAAKNVVSWSALIEGYGRQGMGAEAVLALERMEAEGVEPNGVTFLGVLRACAHSGMVREGYEMFESRMKKYSIKAGIEHYGCVVDMLGRSGRVEEAWELVESMPVRADERLLTGLLSECCRHEDGLGVGVARKVAERLLASEPREAGAYVLLAKLYALLGDLASCERVKELMRVRGVVKETACTWIEVRGS